jgi:hypothetical protein
LDDFTFGNNETKTLVHMTRNIIVGSAGTPCGGRRSTRYRIAHLIHSERFSYILYIQDDGNKTDTHVASVQKVDIARRRDSVTTMT